MYLNHFKINRLTFSINKKFKAKKDKPVLINHEIATRSKYNKKENLLNVIVKVTFNDGNIPFFINIEGEGIFSFDEEVNKELLNQFSTINCPAIIFPYIRETIADITRRAGYPPLHMPSVNFVDLAKENKTPKKKET